MTGGRFPNLPGRVGVAIEPMDKADGWEPGDPCVGAEADGPDGGPHGEKEQPDDRNPGQSPVGNH